MGEIIIIGLGPGPLGLLTMETWDMLNTAEVLLFRTAKHPTVNELKARGIGFESYDYIYDQKKTFDEVYEYIAKDCVGRAKNGQKVTYAVPGSPLVAEKTVSLVRAIAAQEQINVRILPGMSFIEVLYVRLGIDPIDGLTVVDSSDIDRIPRELNTALVVTQVYNRQIASDAKLALMEIYPDDYEVTVVQSLGLPNEKIKKVPLFEIDRLPDIDHLTSVYVPARQETSKRFDLAPLTDVMARLRSPGGCIWDIEQTHKSLRRYIVEEVYEVLEAIDLAEGDKLCEELGDLLLQIVFHARIAEECGEFSMQDVIASVTEKMVRRHPHVFGDITVRDAGEVVLNWDMIKKQEKGHERSSILDGVPQELPSLMKAYKLQAKAAKVGFDWDNINPIWEKIEEEITELKEALLEGETEALEGELGDILFAVVNLARFLGIDAEIALNVTNSKFKNRFAYIEAKVKEKGTNWEHFTLAELDKFWDEAKGLNK
ncbi:nucleoside triphosphate pyrophosphohydrolase [Dendrosporobacter sp. 1207_IL3150]|uniref:nucleoside triphosphate pyrophosphohydrolase n=1 Tax=Dendrosporobacter sp. 1207_IL3150 TaxID=3084054 RepID=UPI002FDAC54D